MPGTTSWPRPERAPMSTAKMLGEYHRELLAEHLPAHLVSELVLDAARNLHGDAITLGPAGGRAK